MGHLYALYWQSKVLAERKRLAFERERFADPWRDARLRNGPLPTAARHPSIIVDDMNKVRAALADKLSSENGLLRAALAEFIGTFFLLFIGISANIQGRVDHSPITSVQLAWGFGFAFAVYLAANVSGAHINPAISVAALVNGKLSVVRFFVYLLFQVLGAFVGAAAAYLGHIDDMNKLNNGARDVTGPNATAGLFATYPSSHMTVYGSLIDQIMGTAILALCIELITDKRHRIHTGLIPLLAGFTMAMISMTYGTNGGFAINPARDLGPRIFLLCVGYGWQAFSAFHYYFWVPIVGPVVGALIGSWVYKLFVGLHGLSEEVAIGGGGGAQKTDSTTGLLEPVPLSWRQTTVPQFPTNGQFVKRTHDPAREESFLSNIRRDFEEKRMDLGSEQVVQEKAKNLQKARAPSPPRTPFSSPIEERPVHVRRLFESAEAAPPPDRPYQSVFGRPAQVEDVALQRRAPPSPPPTLPAPPPPAPHSYSSRASTPQAPPTAIPRRFGNDRNEVQVSLSYYRND